MEDEAETAIEAQLVLLIVKLQVDEGQLAPFGTTDERTAVLRCYLFEVEESLVQ